MKEQTLIEMQKKIDALIRGVQGLMEDQKNITTLASGTFETVRLMPGYEEAIAKLVEKAKEQNKKDIIETV